MLVGDAVEVGDGLAAPLHLGRCGHRTKVGAERIAGKAKSRRLGPPARSADAYPKNPNIMSFMFGFFVVLRSTSR